MSFTLYPYALNNGGYFKNLAQKKDTCLFLTGWGMKGDTYRCDILLGGVEMRGFLVGSVLGLALALSASSYAQNVHKKPKKADKEAVELCAGAMSAGAYETLTAVDLGEYCVELAIILVNADYEPAP
jgi:hypothetical protein